MNSNRTNLQTPRRTLGLSRRTKTPIKRSNNSPEKQLKSSKNNVVCATSISPTENAIGHSIPSAIKRRKMLLESLIFEEENTNTADNKEIIEELITENAHLKNRLENYEKYRIKKKELQHLISIWSSGGKDALNMLREEIKPEQEIEQILMHLKLSTDVFDIDMVD